jgi:hypothetical protein
MVYDNAYYLGQLFQLFLQEATTALEDGDNAPAGAKVFYFQAATSQIHL